MQKAEKYGSYIGKKKAIITIPEGTQMLNLLCKNFASTIINMFKEQKETMSKELKGIMNIMSHQIESISKEIELAKKELNKF